MQCKYGTNQHGRGRLPQGEKVNFNINMPSLIADGFCRIAYLALVASMPA